MMLFVSVIIGMIMIF